MNEKEVGELRRRLRPEKNSITHIRGCYVNEMGESVAQFDQSLALMTQEETETLLALLRRTLSGTLGKNLLDLSFETRQVVEGEEHRRLMRLRDTALKDEEAVEEFSGTLLFVSHDRYFINRTATRILELVNQKFVNYIGNYDYYLEKKEELTEKYAPTAQEATEEVNEETPSEGRLTWQQQKEEQARKRKQENELKKVEKRIEELETRDKEIDDTLVLPDVCTNVGRCAELSREKDKIQAELEELYEKWEELA